MAPQAHQHRIFKTYLQQLPSLAQAAKLTAFLFCLKLVPRGLICRANLH